MKRFALPLWISLGLLLAAGPASAHSTSTSFLSLEAASPEGKVSVRWDLSLHDIVWTIFIDANFDEKVTWEEVQAARPAIERAVLNEIAVQRGGGACALRPGELALAQRLEEFYLSVALSAQCPRAGALAVSGTLFMTGDASQRVLLSLARGGATVTGVLSASSPTWIEPEHESGWRSFARFVGEGMWHVAIGYDHIVFILLLLLPSVLRQVDGRWQGAERLPEVARDLVTIVTAFTIAHSITLALAVTGTVLLPSQPIEVAIAASIAVAGVINLMPRLARARLPLAFGFGLVHGFGFANALAELETQGTGLLPLLAGFNVGVELAQLAIVALVLPLIYSMRATRWYAGRLMPLGSCALGAAGLVWLCQRI